MRAFVAALVFGFWTARLAFATPGDALYIQADDVGLRRAPERAALVILRLERGHRVMEFERRGEWIRVAVFGAVGKEGWIRRALVARQPPDGARARSPRPAPGPAPRGSSQSPHRALPGGLFALAVSGSPALAFAGECDLIGASGAVERRALEGSVPVRFAFRAAAVRCRIRKRDFFGRLIVELRGDGRPIAGAQTAAPFNHVRVRSAGPWGPAAGVRGAIRSPRVSILPEARRRIVPPLAGAVVPPLSGAIVPPLSGSGPPRAGVRAPALPRR